MSCALALLVLAAAPDGGSVEPPTPSALLAAATGPHERLEEQLADGTHVRFGTASRGPVHVWRPRAYSARTAATVVYLHGFYTDVDRAVVDQQLLSQVRDSGRNVLVIMPMAKSGKDDPPWWPRLDELLEAVSSRLRVELPGGPVVLVGHSGAYRTIARWLEDPRVTQVLLIDGMYGAERELGAWLDVPGHQLVLVGFDTQARAAAFASRRPVTARLDTTPYLYDELPGPARRATVLVIQSERADHMGLVTEGKLLPWLLHALRPPGR